MSSRLSSRPNTKQWLQSSTNGRWGRTGCSPNTPPTPRSPRRPQSADPRAARATPTGRRATPLAPRSRRTTEAGRAPEIRTAPAHAGIDCAAKPATGHRAWRCVRPPRHARDSAVHENNLQIALGNLGDAQPRVDERPANHQHADAEQGGERPGDHDGRDQHFRPPRGPCERLVPRMDEPSAGQCRVAVTCASRRRNRASVPFHAKTSRRAPRRKAAAP